MPFGFFQRSSLPGPLAARLKAWQSLPAVNLHQSHYQTRYLVLDLATLSLDPEQGGLQSVAVVGMHRGRVSSDDAYWLDATSAGPEAWMGLLEFLGKSPLVTHKVPFVSAFLERALKQHLELEFRPQWIDLAVLLPELFRDVAVADGRLAHWLARFELEIPADSGRDAMADALGMARLLQRLLSTARLRGVETPADLLEQAKARRWLHGEER